MADRRRSRHGVVRQDNAEYTTTFEFGDHSDVLAVTDPTGVTARYEYDGIGRPTRAQNALGATVTAYQRDGWDVVETDPAGRVSRARANLAGEVVEQERLGSDGAVATRVTTTYDATGNPVTVAAPVTVGGPDQVRQISLYDAANRVSATVDLTSSSSAVTWFGYDAAGNRTRVTDGNGNATTYRYNPWNLLASEREPTTTQFPNDTDRLTSLVYDSRGLTKTVARPGGVTDSMTYNALGNLVGQTSSGGGAASVSRSFAYDEAGRMLTAAQPNGTQTFTYDDRGLLRSSSGPNAVSFTYDAAGRPVTRTDGAGVSRWTYSIGAGGSGLLATATDPVTNVARSFDYYPTGEPRRVTFGATGTTRDYTWDGAGRLATDSLVRGGAPVREAAQSYDPTGNIVSRTVSGAVADAGTHSYSYDLASRLTGWNWAKPTGAPATVAYGWDGAGNRTSVSGGSAQALFVVANPTKLTPAEQLIRTRLETTLGLVVVLRDDAAVEDAAGSGIVVLSPSVADAQIAEKYDEDLGVPVVHLRRQSWPKHQLAATTATISKPNIEITNPAHPVAAGLSGTVAVTPVKRPFGKAETSALGAGAQIVARAPGTPITNNIVFAYDQGAALAGGATAAAKRVALGFDEGTVVALNSDGWKLFDAAVTWTAPPAPTTTYTYNQRNQLVSNSRGDMFAYTARGTRASETVGGVSRTLTFDAADRLTKDATTTYTYDAFDRLHKRGTTTFGYAGAGKDIVATGATKIALDLDGSAVAYQQGTQQRLTVNDVGRGDVIATLDTTGTVLSTRSYEPWGGIIATTGTWDAPLGYQGDYTDPTTNKVQMQARWYDPTTGGFASADTWRLEPSTTFAANRYGYANTNPLRHNDPTGHFAILAAIGIGALVVLATTATMYTMPQTRDQLRQASEDLSRDLRELGDSNGEGPMERLYRKQLEQQLQEVSGTLAQTEIALSRREWELRTRTRAMNRAIENEIISINVSATGGLYAAVAAAVASPYLQCLLHPGACTDFATGNSGGGSGSGYVPTGPTPTPTAPQLDLGWLIDAQTTATLAIAAPLATGIQVTVTDPGDALAQAEAIIDAAAAATNIQHGNQKTGPIEVVLPLHKLGVDRDTNQDQDSDPDCGPSPQGGASPVYRAGAAQRDAGYKTDAWTAVCLPAGTVLWSGLPTGNKPGLFTAPDHVARAVGDDGQAWNLGLQIAPSADDAYKNTYRPQNGAFVLAENTWVAHATTQANPKYGEGGLEQYFVPQWQTNLTGPYAPINMRDTDAVFFQWP